MSKMFFISLIVILIAISLKANNFHTRKFHDVNMDSNISVLSVGKNADHIGNKNRKIILKNRLPSVEHSDQSSQNHDLNLAPLAGLERKEVLDSIIEISDPRIISQDRKIELMTIISRFGHQSLDTLISEVMSDHFAIENSQNRIFLIDSLVNAAKSNKKAREYLTSYIQSMPKNDGSPRIFHSKLLDRLEAFEKWSVYDEDAYKNILPLIESNILRNKFINYYGFSLARRGTDENIAREKIEAIKSEFL